MDGLDKGLLEYQGRPLIEYPVDAYQGQAAHTLISCNRNLEKYRRYGEPLSDCIANSCGPLAGILTGLKHCQSNFLLVLPCDCPAPPRNLTERLTTALHTASADIAYAYDGKRQQYLFALINKNTAPSLEAFLVSGQRSVKVWYQQQNTVQADFSDQPDAFQNINRLEDLNSQAG